MSPRHRAVSAPTVSALAHTADCVVMAEAFGANNSHALAQLGVAVNLYAGGTVAFRKNHYSVIDRVYAYHHPQHAIQSCTMARTVHVAGFLPRRLEERDTIVRRVDLYGSSVARKLLVNVMPEH